MHDKFRGVTSLEKAGEGLSIKFSLADLREMQAVHGKSVYDEIMVAMAELNTTMLEYLLSIGGRNGDDKKALTLEDLGYAYSLADLCQIMLDAVMISLHGKTYAEWVQWVDEQTAMRKARGEDVDPSLPRPEIPSTSTVEQPSGLN